MTRTKAILADIRAGQKHPRWTEAQLAYLLAHADAPVREVAAAIGRTEVSVHGRRNRLLAEGRIAPSRAPMTAADLALLADRTLSNAEVARQTGRTVDVIRVVRSRRGIGETGTRRVVRPWTAADVDTLIELADRPAAEVAARLGRTVSAVAARRSALIGEGLIPRQVTGRRSKPRE